ncbi:hypothetical protein O3Q58_004770 [Salmonella enterica]|uniref:hypothetical protein n=1 Tax=Salmonella enterica TaxID=28901 RepID=UPI000B1F0B86|nr:hypothetical protein [Salmonella enterica]EJP0923461.1 hypothetical protein [Salmonella enterica]EKG5066731.1 hypothetical protein [Salmonella enterica]
MLGGADNPNGELLSYIIGADTGLHWSATLAEIERVKRLYQTKIKKSKKEVG